MKTSFFSYVLFLCFLISTGTIPCHAQTRTLFRENFKNNKLYKKWTVSNGEWKSYNNELKGERNSKDWGVLLYNKALPENYILRFSTLVDSQSYLFELITQLDHNKYLGFLLDKLNKFFAIEDRSLFSEDYPESLIHSTGHIGKLPKADYNPPYEWLNWKIQKTGNQLFIWINDEGIISFTDKENFVNPKGRFGFAINGSVLIKNIILKKTKGKDSLPPENFTEKPRHFDLLLFSE